MVSVVGNTVLNLHRFSDFEYCEAFSAESTFIKVAVPGGGGKKSGVYCRASTSRSLAMMKAMEVFKTTTHAYGRAEQVACSSHDDGFTHDFDDFSAKSMSRILTVGNSTNIGWHKCSVEKKDREEMLNQKGSVIWITGLSGSGKSTLACTLSHALHGRGKLTYILDGDNCRHGLNSDLSFKAEDRAENIRRIGEVAKLFADAGIICITSLISPFRKERDACRALLPEGNFVEVYVDVPLQVCEMRDPKGLYKLARAGKIKGFTGVDDPYEPPLNPEFYHIENHECGMPLDRTLHRCSLASALARRLYRVHLMQSYNYLVMEHRCIEPSSDDVKPFFKLQIVLAQREGACDSPNALAEIVISYLEKRSYLDA